MEVVQGYVIVRHVAHELKTGWKRDKYRSILQKNRWKTPSPISAIMKTGSFRFKSQLVSSHAPTAVHASPSGWPELLSRHAAFRGQTSLPRSATAIVISHPGSVLRSQRTTGRPIPAVDWSVALLEPAPSRPSHGCLRYTAASRVYPWVLDRSQSTVWTDPSVSYVVL